MLDERVLVGLLNDTSPHILVFLAEQYGLRRIPGLSKAALIERILRNLSEDNLQRLEEELIAARFGALSVKELLQLALDQGDEEEQGLGKARLDRISVEEATLLERSAQRWIFTMRGHDVVIDMERRYMACDCEFFRFASRKRMLCKHLATALLLIPEAYARQALIDLLVVREYGGGGYTPSWQFEGRPAA